MRTKGELSNLQMKGDEAKYVVEHGKRQKERGKQPAEPYKGERNPRKALKAAEVDQEAQEFAQHPPLGVLLVSDDGQYLFFRGEENTDENTKRYPVVTLMENDRSGIFKDSHSDTPQGYIKRYPARLHIATDDDIRNFFSKYPGTPKAAAHDLVTIAGLADEEKARINRLAGS